MPTISVIVPVYKVEKYIHRCIDSILKQTFRDFELILVDDGSPDNCGTICDEYAAKDKRIHVIHQENGGLSAARNAGIDWAFANSNSEWLTFIDSDDWVHPEYLERLLNAVLEHHVAVSVCGYVTTAGEEPDIAASEMIPRIWTPEDFYVEHSDIATIAWGKIYRKVCFEKIRYPLGKIHEDEFTTYKILFPLTCVAVIDAPLYYYFYSLTGIMRSPWNEKRLCSIEACQNQLAYMKKNGYRDAYGFTLRKYAKNMSYHISNLKKSDIKNRTQYIKSIRRKLQIVLIMHGAVIPFSDNKWMYELAFPKLMWIYWSIKAKIKKLYG